MASLIRRAPQPKLPVCRPEDFPEEEWRELDPRPEIICFRRQTLATLRHFFELSCQVGRLPSLLGRELFRAKVSHHAIPSFEAQALFVHDVELCLARLSEEHAEMIQLIGAYDFSHEEIGAMLRRSRSWVSCRVAEALDALAELFLQAGVLRENHPDRRHWQVRAVSRQSSAVSVAPLECGVPDPIADGKGDPGVWDEAGTHEAVRDNPPPIADG